MPVLKSKRLYSLCLLIIVLGFAVGFLEKRQPHWLDTVHDPKQSAKNKAKQDYYNAIIARIDQDKDGRITMPEIMAAAKLHFGDRDLDIGSLRYLLTDSPFLMEPSVFDDMMWMTFHSKEAVADPSADHMTLWFSHADLNEDAGLDDDELYILLKTGGRNRSTLRRRTKYRPLMEKLDADQSKALSQSELWTPIKNVIELEGKSSMNSVELAELIQASMDPEKEMVDFTKLTECMDHNMDGLISSTDEEPDFIQHLDKNYSDEIEEHELLEIGYGLDRCMELIGAIKKERARAQEDMEKMADENSEAASDQKGDNSRTRDDNTKDEL